MHKTFPNSQRSGSPRYAIENVIFTENGTCGEVAVPGFSQAAFDRKGMVMPSVIGRYFEIGRVATVSNPAFFLRKAFRSGMSVFTVVMHYEYLPALYQRAHVISGQQFKIVTRFVAFGKSTIDLFSELYDNTDNVLLAVLQFKYALIDMSVRKSVPIAEELKLEYQAYCKPEQSLKPFQAEVCPSGDRSRRVHVVKRPINASDIDRNGHVNNSAYILMCFDCAADATFKDILANFKSDIALYRLQTMDIVYAKECRYGDDITVHCWEDAVDTRRLHFQVNKDGRTPAFHCQMSFCTGNHVSAANL